MKRIITILAAVFLLVAISLFVVNKFSRRGGPRFIKVRTVSPALHLTYDFLGSRPFDGGKMWIASYSVVTNREVFIYDIEKRQILGQVTNGWPVMLFGDPPQLLCSQPARKISEDLFRKLLPRLSGGRITFAPPEEILTYWLLDLEKDTARLVGEIPGTPNFSFFPSPDFRYCYTARERRRGRVYYLLDLQKRSIVELDAPPDACGWWNNTQLLIQNNNADFLLYDVRQRETSPLGVGQVTASLLEHGLTVDDMRQVRALPTWNGREYDFYVTHAHQNWLAKESFLFKLERPDGRLRLISPRFKFEWSDHFDATGRQYLYSGRDFGTNSDGVFLRDVESGLTRALVDAGTNRDYSRPHFYRDSVIHVRSNTLWRISLDGSNDVKLFPPGEPQQSDTRSVP